MKKVVILLSGGMDSTVLLHHHVGECDEVRAISIDYGQRHRKERAMASYQASLFKVPFTFVNLPGLGAVLPGSSQTDLSVDVPEGHYSEESMKATVVPNRNMILLAVAIGHAIAHKADFVSYAAHAGDHAIYPDCRSEFVDALNRAAALCDWHTVEILRPFINSTKADIVKEGSRLGVDFSWTWTCYRGGEIHCGRCGTCVERLLAFHEAGVEDPVEYEDKGFAFQAEKEFREKTK